MTGMAKVSGVVPPIDPVVEDTARKLEKRRAARRKSAAIAWRDQTIARLFSELKRVRPLNDEEKQLFDRALSGAGPKRSIWSWSAKEDRILLTFMARRIRAGRPKPFQPNVEILNIAVKLGRSYMAVHRRIERLRKREKAK